ncbi:TonB-dependent receptor [Sphingorhabdus arenilitoris]|uniref:TonB-dependent receptor n=1 Tax=Sphingorhabdus arenilitoris TaxID=1490041 RepID=A0ABV8RJ60_9SPHN
MRIYTVEGRDNSGNGKKIWAGSFRAALMLSAMLVIPAPLMAQDTDSAADADDQAAPAEEDVIVVTGEISRTIESSLKAKRNLSVIGDAIIGDEVGDLPDLSVAETLERVVGVTSDRFKGGASELSVRGLGAFLGSSYLNGREVSSGSDGRDVNYGQFPSELINGAVIYKTQQASFIEGGVSGIIELQTLRPLDYGKRRIQLQGLVGYSDYEDRVEDGKPLSYRLTGSYVDQFSTPIGEIGIVLGGQLRQDTAPEDIYTTSSTFRPCNTIEGVDRSNDCTYLTDSSGAPTGASDTYFVSNQYIYRAMSTEADRSAIMGAIQWQPSPDLEFNFDAQYSFRDDIEERGNLVIADGRRDIAPIAISPTGALLAWAGESRIENQTVWRQRKEKYLGLGGNVKWTGDKLSLAADVGFSQTKRRQDELDMRIRTNSRIRYEIDTRDLLIPSLTFTSVTPVENNTGLTFDLNNHALYNNGARARRRLENVDDEIFAVRLDGEFQMDGFFSSLQAGVRYGERTRFHDDGIDEEVSLLPGNYFNDAAIAARQSTFIVRDLFAGADTPARGLTFATWDARALYTALTGDIDAGLPTGSTLSAQDTDVSEETFAGYWQGNFDTNMFGLPATGNFGIRAIRTKITSLGISSALETSPGPDPDTITVTEVGVPTINVETNSFWNILPSANLVLELADDKLLRFAAYRAIARPDQESMSAALTFDDTADLGDLGSIVSASGNPFLEPLQSWNADISFEWYASPTSSIAVAAYYKSLQTGFRTDVSNLTLNVDGAPTDVVIGRTVNSNDKSSLFGFEISVQHKLNWLPSPLDGLGFQASYNFADSNFEFPDPTVVDGLALADFTEPANIPGYSKHSANATLFYEKGPFAARVAYKYRSDYFKPFRSDANRFTADQGFLDFSASLDLTKAVQFRFQALNLLDEPNVFYRPTGDSLAETDYSGTRYFVGLRARF